MYTKKCIPNEWINAVVIPIFKKGTGEPLKTTEELVFVTPAIRYSLKSLIQGVS